MRFLFAILCLFSSCVPAHAGIIQSVQILAASHTVPTAYDVADLGSNMSFTASKSIYAKQLCCRNLLSVEATAFIDNGLSTTSPVYGTRDAYFFANSGRCFGLRSGSALSVQWRSNSGSTQTTGSLTCELLDY